MKLCSVQEIINHYCHMLNYGDDDRCEYLESAVYDALALDRYDGINVDDCDCDKK